MVPFSAVLAGRAELFFDDHFRFSTPIAAMLAESLRHHRLPLWNPWIMTGTPLVAERGSMLTHPGMLLSLVLQPSHAVGVLMVLFLGLLAAGTTAFLQALSVRSMLAVGMGAAVGLCGPALSYTSAAPFLATLACWPWILLAALRLVDGKGTLGGGLALGFALLGGDLPGAFLAAVVAYVVFRARGGDLRTGWWRLVTVLVAGLLIGAGSWFPVVWALPFSERGAGIVASEAGRWSFHPGELVGFFWPHPLGQPLPRFTFWPFRWLGERLFLHSIWIGAATALAAFTVFRKGADRTARALTIVACVLLVAATGKWTPLWPILRPLFTFLRYPSKLAAPAALLLALSGGVMLDALLAEPRKLRRLFVAVFALGVLGATVGVAAQKTLAGRAAAPADIVALAAACLRGDALRVALLAAVGAAVAWLADRRRLTSGWAAAAVAALVFLDVFTATESLAWTRSPVSPERVPIVASTDPRGPRVMRLAEVSLGRLALTEKAFTEEQLRQAALLSPLWNAIEHVDVMEPYGLYLGDVATAMAEMVAADPVALAEATATDFVLAEPSARAPWLVNAVSEGRLKLAGLLPAGALVLHVEHALPRSFLAFGGKPVAASEVVPALTASRERTLLNRDRVVAGGAFAGWPKDIVVPSASEALGRLQPATWQPGWATYQVSISAPALLVEADAFLPGWHVFVDGEERPILQANAFGRAVVVPAGDHRVEWQFRPGSVVAALTVGWLSLAACLSVAVAAGISRRRRRP